MSTVTISAKTKAQRKRARRAALKTGSVRHTAADMLRPQELVVFREPELKHFDASSGAYVNNPYTGAVYSLSAITQGVAGNQRVGDSLVVRGIELRIGSYANGASTMTRFVLFAWNVSTALAAPAPGNVLQNVGSAASITSPYNIDSTEQGLLNILADFVVVSTSTGGPGAAFRDVIVKKSLPMDFDNGSNTSSGSIRLLVISDAALAANAANVYYQSRLVFTDV